MNRSRWFVAAVVWQCTVLAHAALTWDQTRIDVSPKAGAEVAAISFRFINSGATPVTIESLAPSCHCTIARVAKPTIAPGESGTVDAVVDLHDLVGMQEKSIAVTTRETPSAPTILTIRLRISDFVELSPRLLAWTHAETPSAKTIALDASPDCDATLVSLECNDSNFAVEFTTAAAGKRYRVSVTPRSTTTPRHAVVRLQVQSPSGRKEWRMVSLVIQ